MIIVNEPLLADFRGSGECGFCKGHTGARDPHHLACRGMGGGHRIDTCWNIIPLCRLCHMAAHDGAICPDSLLALVAAREGVVQDHIRVQRLWWNNLDKNASLEMIEEKIGAELDCSMAVLARRTLEELKRRDNADASTKSR